MVNTHGKFLLNSRFSLKRAHSIQQKLEKNISVFLSFLFVFLITMNSAYAGDGFNIDKAEWDAEKSRLTVKGTGQNRATVTLSNANTSTELGSKRIRDRKWEFRFSNLDSVPCRVKVEQSDGSVKEKDVKYAPADCDGGPVDPPPTGGMGNIRVIAANDLGMHCADKDYQIFSILPPFNVVHAQAIQMGTDASLPRILTNDEVTVDYSAASNPDDPAGIGSINTTGQNINGAFKTNFWGLTGTPDQITGKPNTWGGLAYGSLYPSVLAGALLDPPQDLSGLCNLGVCPSILNVFEAIPVDVGLPVPELGDLANGILTTFQQEMPGPNNDPKPFTRFDKDVHFFGGVIPETNWFAADGIPILPVDDQGRSNAYPLMKVSATSIATGKSNSVDLVLPVASEADCQNCHAAVGEADSIPEGSNTDGIASTFASVDFEVVSQANAPGPEPLANAAKINILRLHDAKHGEKYTSSESTNNLNPIPAPCNAANPDNCIANQTPVQCAQCHYTPALDLTQGGPVNEPEQGIKGRQQQRHISMSRAMHFTHGEFTHVINGATVPVFPSMPEADDPLRTGGGLAVNGDEEAILDQTCYQCHPGKNTQCLRGAMFNGGVVCQDCHGGMKQVGDDYSEESPHDVFGGTQGKRIPWAVEPKCQSCHTGDASNKNHPAGGIVADDGIRLLQAYTKGDITATPITEMASRFAENQSLYRLSGNKDDSGKGHGGVMCEGCHGSTHAIWPNVNPFANDNVTSNQIQGHTGTIAECDSCHAKGTLGNTLDGPHGMHPVGGTEFADGGHEDLAEDQANECRSCHGQNGEGTVLSKVATNRSFVIDECKDGTLCPGNEVNNFTVNLNKGDQVSCVMCHENEL